MNRRKVVRTFVFITAGLAVLYIAVYGFFSLILPEEDTRSLTILKTKSGYVLDIRADTFMEISRGISCTVMKNGDTIFPLRRIGGTVVKSRELEFALIEAEDELVAVVEKSAPHVVLAIYDLKNYKSWEDSSVIGQELLQRLNKTNPEKPFVLRSSIGGMTNLKVQ